MGGCANAGERLPDLVHTERRSNDVEDDRVRGIHVRLTYSTFGSRPRSDRERRPFIVAVDTIRKGVELGSGVPQAARWVGRRWSWDWNVFAASPVGIRNGVQRFA